MVKVERSGLGLRADGRSIATSSGGATVLPIILQAALTR